MKQNKLLTETQAVSFILIGLAIFGFVVIFFQIVWIGEKPENFGVVGDALDGILNPIIAIAAALLTFMAFYIQKLANDELKNQFIHQQNSQKQDLIYKNYKERILLIINEINNFTISFHGGTLIADTNSLNETKAKKYNFIGIQAINLFLVEYFKLKKAKIDKGETELIIEDSYHAILLQINNLISAFFNVTLSVEQCELEIEHKSELEELLSFTYHSKFNYFVELLKKQTPPPKTKEQVDYLHSHYKLVLNKKDSI